MSTKLKAGTASTGAVLDADTTGILELQTGSTPTTAITVDTSQNVGIGTNTPAHKLAVAGNTFVPLTNSFYCYTADYGMGTPDSAALQIFTGSSDSIRFGQRSSGTFTEKVRIDGSGNLLVGTSDSSGTSGIGTKIIPSATAPNIKIVGSASTSADSGMYMYSTGAGAFRFYVDYGGTIHATSIVISAISDERLKENIKDIDTGLDAVIALKPRRFDWKEGKGQNKKNAAGFIAQEFEKVFPESVGSSEPGEDGIAYKDINHETLIPTLVKAIQELNAKVIALETQLGDK